MHWNIAAAKGVSDPAYNRIRDLVAQELTPEQIAKAEQMAQEWMR
jgi:cytochrome P450